MNMKQYEIFELQYKGEEPQGSHVAVDLSATFTIDGEMKTVRGFYAGNGSYVIRFLPEKTGSYVYHVSGCITDDGEVVCTAADPGRHGLVRAVGTHFQYTDGTWFYPFGTTVYALVHQDKALIDQTMDTLSASPFNKVRMCVFPKSYDYNHNDPEFYAFEKNGGDWNPDHPCFAFWDHLEARIRQLDQMGIQCDLILFHPYDRWGFAKLSRTQSLTYLDYLTRRLGAFPNVWWSLANEYELLKWPMEDWKEFAHFLHNNDGCHHLLSNHNIFIDWDFANEDTTHICVQSSELDKISQKINKFKKPMMVDECRYEGNIPLDWGNISGFEMVNRFWKVCLQGGYCTHGETFLNEEGILWWSRGGKLVGESPARIAFLREILESLPGPLTYGGIDWTEEMIRELRENPPERMKDSVFYEMLKSMPDGAVIGVIDGNRQFIGRYGDEAFLKYYVRDCTSMGTLELPSDGSYSIEVIDVLEMTRTPAAAGVSGTVEVKLPGKEGMAILAIKEK